MVMSRPVRFAAATSLLATALFSQAPLTAKADHTHVELIRAAHELDEAAEHFHDLLHSRAGLSHLAADAHRLADAAQHLHQSAEHGASVSHLRRDFAAVRAAFLHLEHQFEHDHSIHHNRHVLRDWWQVENAMYRLGRLFAVPAAYYPPFDPHVSRYHDPASLYRFGHGRNYIRVGPLAFHF